MQKTFTNAVVSANYRDRSSSLKWLVRSKDQAPEDAIAVNSVEATGVKFVRSSVYEEGFGCRIVAECDSVVADVADLKPAHNLLQFDDYYFVDITGDRIDSCDRLTLTESGGISFEMNPVEQEVKEVASVGE